VGQTGEEKSGQFGERKSGDKDRRMRRRLGQDGEEEKVGKKGKDENKIGG